MQAATRRKVVCFMTRASIARDRDLAKALPDGPPPKDLGDPRYRVHTWQLVEDVKRAKHGEKIVLTDLAVFDDGAAHGWTEEVLP